MSHEHEDVVKAATGSLVEMNLLKDELEEAGVFVRLVGDDLATGLGSALSGSVELWVRAADAGKVTAILERDAKLAQLDVPRKFPHPQSDPKPDRSQGPHHPPEPHRPSP
jgi:hypothetical protein